MRFVDIFGVKQKITPIDALLSWCPTVAAAYKDVARLNQSATTGHS
jgi:hypothetical protein